MPSNKTISTLIVCMGIVISVWLFSNQNESQNIIPLQKGEVEQVILTKETVNDDWKKLLTNLDDTNNKVTDLTDSSDINTEEDDSTLTDQLSRDFMSQYLLAIKSGQTINKETASVIAQKTLSLPEYNQRPVVYIRQNLKVIQKNDKETYRRYADAINENMESLYYGLSGDPLEILINALNTESEVELKKLDPIIYVTKGMLKYFLNMQVPENAVVVHLEVVNSISAILKDMEYMRDSLNDPIKIFPAINNYTENSTAFSNALEKMNLFLSKNI